jgi:hypothetical protein
LYCIEVSSTEDRFKSEGVVEGDSKSNGSVYVSSERCVARRESERGGERRTSAHPSTPKDPITFLRHGEWKSDEGEGREGVEAVTYEQYPPISK